MDLGQIVVTVFVVLGAVGGLIYWRRTDQPLYLSVGGGLLAACYAFCAFGLLFLLVKPWL